MISSIELKKWSKERHVSIVDLAKYLAKTYPKYSFEKIHNAIKSWLKNDTYITITLIDTLFKFNLDNYPDPDLYSKYLPEPKELMKMRDRMGLTRKAFLIRIGLSPENTTTLYQYETGNQRTSPMISKAYYLTFIKPVEEK